MTDTETMIEEIHTACDAFGKAPSVTRLQYAWDVCHRGGNIGKATRNHRLMDCAGGSVAWLASDPTVGRKYICNDISGRYILSVPWHMT